ncbi:MAG: DNA-formamidopyrimidine glycosylase [candidate division KSB1 bacterium]|nr:DNA-formamidopyrimidine glycosylase [candidate division KSB1 bacterium]
MPELPEVQVIVTQLRDKVLHKKIVRVEILRTDQWLQNDPAQVVKILINQAFVDIYRKGKYIIFRLEDGFQLIVHLRMTGKFCWHPKPTRIDKHTRTVFYFTDGSCLHYHDLRALGMLILIPPNEEIKSLSQLGADPLSPQFTREYLWQKLQGCKLELKDFLLDQKKVAGVGNIYASEILFRSSIHPQTKSFSLSPSQVDRLYQAIPQVLREALVHSGTTISNYRNVDDLEGEFQNFLQVYGKEGQPCPRCGQVIKRLKQKNRSTFFCESCQK